MSSPPPGSSTARGLLNRHERAARDRLAAALTRRADDGELLALIEPVARFIAARLPAPEGRRERDRQALLYTRPNELEPLVLLDTSCAAALCGLSIAAMKLHRRLGTGPWHYRLGPCRVGYRIDAITAWLAQRKVEQRRRPRRPGRPAKRD